MVFWFEAEVPTDSLPMKSFTTPASWRTWLAKNHGSAPGIWVQFAKKGSGVRSITYAEAVEGALCYGWIDGQTQRIDDTYYIQRYTPRRQGSIWSAVNRKKAIELIERGSMEAAGLAAIEQAKANGRWDSAYAGPRTADVPEDLAEELQKRPKAAAFFASLRGQNRYAILFRLQTAKKPETRANRLKKFVAMLERGETLHP